MLKNQLTAFGDVPIVEVVTLEEANLRLRAALTKLMEGDEKAQDDFDKWDRYINNHPDHIKQKEEEERAWAERNKGPNEEALRVIRTFVPPDIYCSNLKGLKERMPEKGAERVFGRKILWLTRSSPELIAKTHIAELKTKFQAHGLDLVELRAICTVLPQDFENDADGAKGMWKSKLLDRLRELVAKEEKGDVQKRNSAYDGMEAGPFDPDASPVRQKHTASTPYTKNNLDDVVKLCKEGGNFNENRDTLRKKREEGSVVVPNGDRIDHSKIGVVMEDNKDFMSRLESCLGGTPVATPRKVANGFLDEIAKRKTEGEDGSGGGGNQQIKAKLNAIFGGGGGGGGEGGSGTSFLNELKAQKRNKKVDNVNVGGEAGGGGERPSFLEELKAKRDEKAEDDENDENRAPPSFLEEIKKNKSGKTAEKRKGGGGLKSPLGIRQHECGNANSQKKAGMSFLEEIAARAAARQQQV
ncbi:hypothetical protein TrST_g7489 [Triparma strigata]|nr:hypothetical protein TrST_g7489 [Triparma strigata]